MTVPTDDNRGDHVGSTDAVSSPESAEPAPIRVVVAEDEAIIRLDLTETLASMGIDVVADVGNGNDALEAIRRERPDLAILDIKMDPGPTGLDVAREVTDANLCAVLILTAFSQNDLVEEAVEAGVMSYLVKPFQRASLKPAIDVSLARFRELQAVRAEVDDLEEQFAVRKLVDRAKGMIMDSHGLREQEAFSFVQKTAMASRLPMRTVAEQIIAGELTPGDSPPPAAP